MNREPPRHSPLSAGTLGPTVSDEGSQPIPVGDGVRDPAATGATTGGSPPKDITRLQMLFGSHDQRMFRVEVLAGLALCFWLATSVAVITLGACWLTFRLGWWIGG